MSAKVISVGFAITKNVKRVFTEGEIINALLRHLKGDWGDLRAADKKSNDKALKTGARLLSAYNFKGGRRMWVITEAANDNGIREYTTCLMPEEY